MRGTTFTWAISSPSIGKQSVYFMSVPRVNTTSGQQTAKSPFVAFVSAKRQSEKGREIEIMIHP